MRLWVFSDVHLEFDYWQRPTSRPDADVCVVAGDVRQGCSNSIRWLAHEIGQLMPVIFVAGNHEFYGHSVIEGVEWGREIAKQHPSVHFLENDSVVIGGVRFLGCTLWTDYELDGDEQFAMAVASQQLNDHRRVMWRMPPSREPFTPARALELHERSRGFLTRELEKPFDGKTVVVTHHAPHPYSVNRRYKGSALNPAFASDLADVFVAYRPDLWVHGHMHESCDYTVGSTRVACNPKGYADENPAFDAGLIVEV